MQEEISYYSVPQPNEISDREKEDAMGAYLMMFASAAIGLPFPILNLIAAIIYYFVNKSKGRFVRFHTLQSLFSQIPLTLINTGAVVWLIRIFVYELGFSNEFWGYIIMLGVANLTYFIFSIIGAIRARKGRFYYFWFFGTWSYQVTYKMKDQQSKSDEPINKPPL